MASKIKALMKVIGIRAYGDLGPLTCYSKKNGDMVFFDRAPPDKPASTKQLHQRARFKAAMLDWKRLAQTDRDIWESISLTSAIPYTGLNLHMMCELRIDMIPQVQTYAASAGHPTLPPIINR